MPAAIVQLGDALQEEPGGVAEDALSLGGRARQHPRVVGQEDARQPEGAGHIRLSYAASIANLEEAARRIAQYVGAAVPG